MTKLPGPVKTVAAVCAFLTVSYAVSVWAAPRTGIEDLGMGGPETVAGAYGRDPAPPPSRRPGRSQQEEAGGAGVGPGDRDRVAAPSVTPVSARTGVAEAALAIAPAGPEPPAAGDVAPDALEPAPVPDVVTPPPAGGGATPTPQRPSTGGTDSSPDFSNGSNGSRGHSKGPGRSHGHGASHGGGRCGGGGGGGGPKASHGGGGGRGPARSAAPAQALQRKQAPQRGHGRR